MHVIENVLPADIPGAGRIGRNGCAVHGIALSDGNAADRTVLIDKGVRSAHRNAADHGIEVFPAAVGFGKNGNSACSEIGIPLRAELDEQSAVFVIVDGIFQPELRDRIHKSVGELRIGSDAQIQRFVQMIMNQNIEEYKPIIIR